MTIIQYSGMALTLIYGTLTALGGIIQIKLRNVPLFSALGFFITGGVLACTPFLFFQSTNIFYLLILSLLFIHLIALFNGYYLYRKWTVQHHLVRFFLSILIILLWLEY